MYKRAVISDEISQDLTVAAGMARDFGLDAVELRNLWDRRADQLDDADVERVRAILDEHGLRVAAIAAPFFKSTLDDEAETREHIQILRRAIRIGRRLGTSIVRGFVFWKDRPLTDAVYALCLKRYEEPLRIAAAEGITLAIENEHATLIGTGAQLGRFLSDLASPVAKALWDPGNARYDVQRERAFPDGYHTLVGRIAHVHIKDCALDPTTGDPAWVPLGKGEIDIAGQLRALVSDAYEGYVSLETHYRPKRLGADLLRSPSGRVFSELGAQATAECLANWDELRRST